MKRAIIAATVYFLALFALGFALGTLRVTVIAPRFGELAATVAEVPVMLAAAYFTSRWAIGHWQVPHSLLIRWAMTFWFLTLLLLFEILLGTMLLGRTVAVLSAALATPAGLLGLTAQFIAALSPVFVGRDVGASD